MSASLGDALLFVTLALGAAIKREFIYVSYFLKIFILCVFMSPIQEHLLLKLRLLIKQTQYMLSLMKVFLPNIMSTPVGISDLQL